MKKYIKNLSTVDRVLQFELDQLRLQVSALHSEVDRIEKERIELLENRKLQRAHVIDTPDVSMTFNAYEQWTKQTHAQMEGDLRDLEVKIEELHEYLMEKFQDSKKINHSLIMAKSDLRDLEKKNEQKVFDQLGELRFHLRKLKGERG